MSSAWIRPARLDDLPRLTEIYNHYVAHSPATFDLEAKTLEQRYEWFAQFKETGRHRLLVAEEGGVVLGYAGTTRWRPKPAYDTTVETTVYCAPEAVGRGIGARLFAALFEAIAARMCIGLWRDMCRRIRRPRRCMRGLDFGRWGRSARWDTSSESTGMCVGWREEQAIGNRQ